MMLNIVIAWEMAGAKGSQLLSLCLCPREHLCLRIFCLACWFRRSPLQRGRYSSPRSTRIIRKSITSSINGAHSKECSLRRLLGPFTTTISSTATILSTSCRRYVESICLTPRSPFCSLGAVLTAGVTLTGNSKPRCVGARTRQMDCWRMSSLRQCRRNQVSSARSLGTSERGRLFQKDSQQIGTTTSSMNATPDTL